MAAGLDFKVYRGKELVATTRHAEDAASVAASTSNAVIKYAGRIVWREGRESISAGQSYDQAAETMWDRIQDHRRQKADKDAQARAKFYGIA